MLSEFAASLADKWEGPYRISAKVARLAYKLVHCDTGDECGSTDVNDLKRFINHPEDTGTLQVPVTTDPDSRSDISSSLRHCYNLRQRR